VFGVFAMQRVVALRASRPKGEKGESEHRPVGGCVRRRMQARALPVGGCVRRGKEEEGGERAPPGGRVPAPLDAGCVRRQMQVRALPGGGCVRRGKEEKGESEHRPVGGCEHRPVGGCVRRQMQGAFVNDSTVTVAPVAFTCEDFVRNSMMDSAD
jgi:hypothetical protein